MTSAAVQQKIALSKGSVPADFQAGLLNFQEGTPVEQMITAINKEIWRTGKDDTVTRMFSKYNRSANIDRHQLQSAIQSVGYQLSDSQLASVYQWSNNPVPVNGDEMARAAGFSFPKGKYRSRVTSVGSVPFEKKYIGFQAGAPPLTSALTAR